MKYKFNFIMRNARLICGLMLCLLPMLNLAAKDVMSGTCGDDIIWRVTDKNELIISGDGMLESYLNWQMSGEYKTIQEMGENVFPNKTITKITVKGNPKHMDQFIYDYFPACTEIVLPASGGMVSVGGVVFSADKSRLLRFPAGRKGEYKVPDGVTELAEKSFYGSALTSVQMPTSLRVISSWSFANSSLMNVVIPEGVDSIGICAFQHCHKLHTLQLSSTVRVAETMLGGWCESFESYEVSPKNPYLCAINGVLYSKNMDWLMDYPEGKKEAIFTCEQGVKAIAPDAFTACAYLQNVRLAESVWWVSGRAFSQCKKLSFVKLPDGLYAIGDHAFERCPQLKEITLPAGIKQVGKDLFSETYLEKLIWNVTDCEQMQSNSFPALKELVIGNQVKHLPEQFMANAKGLKVLRIPAGVESVGKGAFAGCVNVEEIYWNAENCADLEEQNAESQVKKFIIGDNVKRLPAYLCANMKNLKQIAIPNSVKEIGAHAFLNDVNLTNISLGTSVETIGDNAFAYTAVGRMVFPKSIQHCGKQLFDHCDKLNEVMWLPEDFTGFDEDNNLFYYKDKDKDQITYDITRQIKSIQFGDDVIRIPDAFCAHLASLNNIYLPAKLQRIGYYAFGECSAIQHVVMPSGVKVIESGAFFQCSALQSVNMSLALEEIGDYAFKNCQALNDIRLPFSLRKIGRGAFYSCYRLQYILLPAELEELAPEAFMFARSEHPVTIPAGLTNIGNMAFSCLNAPEIIVDEKNPAYSSKNGMLFDKEKTVLVACTRQVSGKIKLPSSVREIAEGALAYSQIETVELPAKLEVIGANAFYGSAITSIIIPKGVTLIKATTFQKCENLEVAKFKSRDTFIEPGAFEPTTQVSF